jgi:hypothetical protein
MSEQSKNVKGEIKKSLKQNIARAWYKLDQQSYERWLEGRKVSQSKFNY